MQDLIGPAVARFGGGASGIQDQTVLLAPNLSVVFCGTAAGHSSAKAGTYYAGQGNHFWPTLHQIGLTPRKFSPSDYPELLEHGIGLTDLVKTQAGADSELASAAFGVSVFEAKLSQAAPRVVAFNGKKAATAYYGVRVEYGQQARAVVGITSFVLPSTSGAARGHWDESQWQALAEYLSTVAD